MGISKQNFHVVPHAQICVSKMKRDRRDNIQRFIIIFMISIFFEVHDRNVIGQCQSWQLQSFSEIEQLFSLQDKKDH